MSRALFDELTKKIMFLSLSFLIGSCGTSSLNTADSSLASTDWFVEASTVKSLDEGFLTNCPYTLESEIYKYECGDHFWGEKYWGVNAGKSGMILFDGIKSDSSGHDLGPGPVFINDSNNVHHQYVNAAFGIGTLKSSSDLKKYAKQYPGKKLRVRAVLDFSAEGHNAQYQSGTNLGYGVYSVSGIIILGGCYGTQDVSERRNFTVNSQIMKPYTITSIWNFDPKDCPVNLKLAVVLEGKKVQFHKVYWQIMDRF